MSYLNTYFSRVNHLGKTTAERIRKGGIISFNKWLAESPHTIADLSVERGIYFSGIIIRNKDKEYTKIMMLHVSNETKLVVGDIMNWTNDNNEIEKWLILSEEKKANGTYRTFQIIKCNYLIKWIDSLGHIQQSWAYVLSSLDSKIKGNYRTWNSLITPQPNKYAEILMPRMVIDRATNFIIEDESWSLIEYDYTSVPGTIYLSLTENKINTIYDDLNKDLADTDKLADYQFSIPESTEHFSIGTPIKPTFVLNKNGIPYAAETELISLNTTIAKPIDGVLTAVGEGIVDIIIRVKDYPFIQKTITVNVDSTVTDFDGYIKGADIIRLDREESYILEGTKDIIAENITYAIDKPEFAVIMKLENGICTIHANDQNKLGTFTLTAEYLGKIYSKTIKIIPLWGR